jgi:hypothetical protein
MICDFSIFFHLWFWWIFKMDTGVEKSYSAGGYFHGNLEHGNPLKSSIEAEVRRSLQLAIMDSWLGWRLSAQWLQYVSFEGRLAGTNTTSAILNPKHYFHWYQ